MPEPVLEQAFSVQVSAVEALEFAEQAEALVFALAVFGAQAEVELSAAV